MPLPEYESKIGPESQWAAIVGSLTTITGLVLMQLDLSPELAVAVSGLVAGLARLAMGYLLPSPSLPTP